MTRTAIRHMRSALAGIVLISVFTSAPASAQGGNGRDDGWAIGMRIVDQPSVAKRSGSPISFDRSANSHKGLAAKKGSDSSSMAKPKPPTGLTSPVGFNQGLLR